MSRSNDSVVAGPAWLEAYRECRLCPRDCGIDRRAGKTGFCGETAVCRVAAAVPHFGEEPSFSGRRGSGTIFFSGCSCGCFFCQNHQISRDHLGAAISPGQLLSRVLELLDAGVHNLNLVTPDHFLPHVEWLCRELRRRGLRLPILYNCSGYAAPDSIARAAEVVDVFLPDMKFADPELADLCMGDRRYPAIAFAAITAMIAAKGMLRPWDDSGRLTARHGVLVRHLVLPGFVDNSIAVLDGLYRRFGPDLPLSIMSQFRPVPACRDQGALEREVTAEEYRRVVRRAEELGFEHVYIQPAHGDAAFLPDFSRPDEPFAGNLRH